MKRKAFTLIELLIVIIILAILAAIVVFAVGTTGQNAKNAACGADAKTFESALEAYKAEVGVYPGQTGTTTGTPNLGSALTSTTTGSGGATVGPFMRALPSTAHYTIWTDGVGGVYVLPAWTSTTTGPPAPTTTQLTGTTNNFDTGTPCTSVPS